MSFLDRVTQVGYGENCVFFCNGIQNTRRHAIESAEKLSQALNGRTVCCFHNDTTFNQVANRNERTEQQHQARLASELASALIHQLGKQDQVELFLHSHGAFVGHQALKMLNAEQKNRIVVYTFGAADLIPKNLAKRVHQYVHEEDGISIFGTQMIGTDGDPETFKMYRAISHGKSLFETTWEKACEDVSRELKKPSYQQLNQQLTTEMPKQSPEAQLVTLTLIVTSLFAVTIQRQQCHQAVMQKFNVQVLPGYPKPEMDELGESRNFKEFVSMFISNVSKAGKHILGNHSLENYLYLVPNLPR